MTARSISFTGIGKDGTVLTSIEPHWWAIGELGQKVNLNWVKTSEPGYEDEDADLSHDDARTIHEQFKPKLLHLIQENSKAAESTRSLTENLAPPRENAYAKYVRELESALAELESALADNSGKYSHFHICVYEWDSGL